MKSMKQKFLSLGLAALLLFSVAGCSFKTPATVGSIGGVDIPAGVYLLAQYNAYNTAASGAELATGETANDVKKVLNASVTGTIGDEEVTENGKQFVADLTQRSIEYYAAVEAKFDALGGTLEDAATAEAAANADSTWESNGDLYTANGISKASVQNYQLNAQKAKAILNLTYGAEGTDPVTESEYTDYIENECLYLDTVVMPLYDQSTYAFADDEQTAAIEKLAQDCVASLSEQASPETASDEVYTYLYLAAAEYLPQVYTAMGVTTFDASQAYYYAGSQLFTPNDIASYDGADGTNTLADAAAALAPGEWGYANLGMNIVVFRHVDPLLNGTVDELAEQYSLLAALKGDTLQSDLYAEGAAMEHNLSDSARNTYKPGNIKKTV
ncbi:MAG: hypothetical protein PHO10_10065 [Gemmiger sp.]|nr:hypothetical protein [Gemmiger sp.]